MIVSRRFVRVMLGAVALGTAVWGARVSLAADHLDFPEDQIGTEVELAAEITDVLAWTPDKGRLALVMNVHPDAGLNSAFAPHIDYQFRLRPVQMSADDEAVRKATVSESEEFIVSCNVPGTEIDCTVARCDVDSGDRTCRVLDTIAAPIDEVSGQDSDPLRVWAGLRADSFYADLQGLTDTIVSGFSLSPELLMPRDIPENTAANKNVLTVAVNLDVSVLGATDTMFAVVGETARRGDQ